MMNVLWAVLIIMFVVYICAMVVGFFLWKNIKKQISVTKTTKNHLKTELEINKIILTRIQRMCSALLQEQERRKEAVTEQIKKQLDHVSLSDSWEEAETTREVGEAITKIKKKKADTDEDSVFIVN